ncbi:hypothetical protein N8342_12505, partial [Acidimicrobiales bacterium]|nr:hypothetical protein [Acidimicrobiales bacterium]
DAHLVNTIGALLTIDGGTDEVAGTGAATTVTATTLVDLNADFPSSVGTVVVDYNRFKVDVRSQADIGDLFMTVDDVTGLPVGVLRFQANGSFEDHDVFVFNYEICESQSSNCDVYVVVIDESMLDDTTRDITIDVRSSTNRADHVVDLVGATIEITDGTGATHTSTITANDSGSLTFESIGTAITAASYRITSIPKRGDVLTVDNSGDKTDNTVTVTQTTIDGLNMPSVPEVQTVFVKAASGTYTLIAEVDGDEIEIPLEFNLSAEGFQARLRAYYEFEGIDVTAVRTSRGVTYTIEFVRFQAGRNFAELRWDGDIDGLTSRAGDSAEIETETVREGRNAPIAEVQTIQVQADGGSFLLRVDGFGRDHFEDIDFDLSTDADLGIRREDDSAAVPVSYDTKPAELAALLNQLFGYTGISVTEVRDATADTVLYTVTFGGVDIGRDAPKLSASQTDDLNNDGVTITPIHGTPFVLTVAGFGTDNTDVDTADDAARGVIRTSTDATITVTFGDDADDVAAAINQLLGLRGLAVTKQTNGTKAIFTIDDAGVLNVDGAVIAAGPQFVISEFNGLATESFNFPNPGAAFGTSNTEILFANDAAFGITRDAAGAELAISFAANEQFAADAVNQLLGRTDVAVTRTAVDFDITFTVSIPSLDVTTFTALGFGTDNTNVDPAGDAGVGVTRTTDAASLDVLATDTAATVQAAIRQLFANPSIDVTKVVGLDGVEFILSLAGVDIDDLDLNALIAVDDFVLIPAEGEEQALLVGDTLTNGKKLNNLQTLTINASGGTFDLTLLGTPVTIPFDATPEDLICNVEDRRRLNCGEAMLEDIVNPNNSNDALPFTNNLSIRKHGNVLHFIFQGAHRHLTINPADIDTTNLVGTVTLDDRNAGINYYEIDVLNIDLGEGDDVANVQGTSAATNL